MEQLEVLPLRVGKRPCCPRPSWPSSVPILWVYNRYGWLPDDGLYAIMKPRTLHTLELTAAVVGQTLLLAAGWGFLGAVFVYDPLIVPDSLAVLMLSKSTAKIVTLIATVLSIATTTYGFVRSSWDYPSRWFTDFCQSLSRKHCGIGCTSQSHW